MHFHSCVLFQYTNRVYVFLIHSHVRGGLGHWQFLFYEQCCYEHSPMWWESFSRCIMMSGVTVSQNKYQITASCLSEAWVHRPSYQQRMTVPHILYPRSSLWCWSVSSAMPTTQMPFDHSQASLWFGHPKADLDFLFPLRVRVLSRFVCSAPGSRHRAPGFWVPAEPYGSWPGWGGQGDET